MYHSRITSRPVTGQVLAREDLPHIRPAWHRLADDSAESNVYYSPRYASALLASVEAAKEIRFATVWNGEKLAAFLPVTRAPFAAPFLQIGWQAWQSKYMFSCTPLLDRQNTDIAADALLDVLGGISTSSWMLPLLNTGGAACTAVQAALERRGLPYAILGAFQRAGFENKATFDEHMTRHVAPKRRKDLARTWRRLAERGEVQHESHRSGGGLDGAIRAFLDIEAQGWKGGRGTALACDPLTQRFALEAFTGDAAHSICRADVLAVDGKAIAVSLAVIAGKVAYTVKCAYDETYRKYSPGLLLEVEVIRSFLADRWAERLDSAAGDGHIIGELWPDRIDVGDLVFALSPRFANGRLAILTRTEQWRRNFRETAKRWLGR